MMKAILKWFIPSPTNLAKIATNSICDKINSTEKLAKVAEYSDYADMVIQTASTLNNLIRDGKIDEMEKEEIAKMLEPVFKKAIDLI